MLERALVRIVEDAQQKIDAFRWDYNEHHPHRSLKGLALGNSQKGCSQRPRAHSPSGPKKGVPSLKRRASFYGVADYWGQVIAVRFIRSLQRSARSRDSPWPNNSSELSVFV